MTERRNGVYRGFEMSANVESHPTGGFHVVALWVRLTASTVCPPADSPAFQFGAIMNSLLFLPSLFLPP